MIERTFVDRVPTYPGRVTLTPVAGQPNVYDMVRSDSPTEPGTPLNKATFDGVAKNRLTGRFYQPEVSRVVASSLTDAKTNPIPVSGWIEADGGASNAMRSGSYKATASSVFNNSYAAYIFNNTSGRAWVSGSGATAWVALEIDDPITVKKMRLGYGSESTSISLTCTVQGSTNGSDWVNLLTVTDKSSTGEYTLTKTGNYRFYRLHFDAGGNETRVTVVEWTFSSYDVTTYTNKFTVPFFPDVWDVEQRATIFVPQTVSMVSTVSNTLNGISVNTILQPGKRYELRYTGSAFVAKEV